ncbi:hypothetical protein [Murinocardiopsis flavida]|uniref:hypothetical protein n=1 Tax=Murinocardiopsis flavida TaxID=645275 RepID=UPI001FEBC050|nr:hypothetical protein [Murinocardiopsis flavida]
MPDSTPASTVAAPPRARTAHRPEHEDAARARPQAAGTAGPAVDDLAGIGDIVLAGAASGYAHLAARDTVTIGRLAAAARAAADALARPTLWPRRADRWQPAPRTARRGVSGRMRVSVVALRPNAFVELAADRPRAGRTEARSEVLALVSGQAHLVVTGPDGALLAVQELARGKARVLGASGGHQLINTGTATLVAVRVGA